MRSYESGSILIVALWTVFMLSMTAVAINLNIGPQLDLAGSLMGRFQMRALAVAGFERAVFKVEKNKKETYSARDGSWSDNQQDFKDVETGAGTFSVFAEILPDTSVALNRPENVRYGLSDEESKININKAPIDILKNLFEIAGAVSPYTAGDLAVNVSDWREKRELSAAGDAKSFYYLSLAVPYECKSGEFEVLEELMLVKGITPGIFEKIRPVITIYGSGAVNLNTADEVVLRCLGMTGELAGAIVSFRNGTDGIAATSDDNVFSDIATVRTLLSKKASISGEQSDIIATLRASGQTSVRTDTFSGKAVGRLKNGRDMFALAFVYDRQASVIRYWKEE